MKKETLETSCLLFFICSLGLILRSVSWINDAVINPDGPLYIYQASAIYSGHFNRIIDCTLQPPIHYSFFVAAAYPLFNNWEIAARSVSLFFATLFLIPFYVLQRYFFNRSTSLLVTLIFAVLPVFVRCGIDVARESVFWFFLVTGLCLFVGQMGKQSTWMPVLSALCFLIAAWNRIEALLFLAISLPFFFWEPCAKWRKLAWFSLPMGLLLGGLLLVKGYTGSCETIAQYMTRLSFFTNSHAQYGQLREILNNQILQADNYYLESFFREVHSLTWFVGVGTLINRGLEASFYPFALIGFLGLGGRHLLRHDRRLVYLLALGASGLILLYLFILSTWVMEYRYMFLAIIPASVLYGFGLEKIIAYSQAKCSRYQAFIPIVLGIAIVLVPLYRNLLPEPSDDQVYKEIGTRIYNRQQEIGGGAATVLTSSMRWVAFYANQTRPDEVCVEQTYEVKTMIGDTYPTFLDSIQKNGFKYAVWEENKWPTLAYDLKGMLAQHFIPLGEWRHPNAGQILVYQVPAQFLENGV